MEKIPLSVLDVYAPAVRQVIQTVAPAELAVSFADSYDEAEQTRLTARADVVIAGWARISEAMIAAAPSLRMVQKWGIGVDRIDVEALRRKGIPLSITAGINAGPVAEHAVMLMLSVLRRISLVDPAMRRDKWLKAEMRSVCLQLTGRTVGLVGFGNIGRMVALKLRGFDCKIRYYDVRRLDAPTERAFGATWMPLDELIATSDILSLHAPYTGDNRHLIDAAALARMQPHTVLINTARGELIDEAALYEALAAGRIFGAGLDAFDPEPPEPGNKLMTLDNVVVTPHTGGAVFDNVENTARHAIGNVMRFLRGEEIASADVIIPVKR